LNRCRMKNPSPGSCFGGWGRPGDATVPTGAALTTTRRRTPVACIAPTMARVPCETLPADTAGRREDGELHLCSMVGGLFARSCPRSRLRWLGAIASWSPPGGVGGTAECLGAQDLRVARIGRKDLAAGLLPPDLRSLDADALHVSAPRPLATGWGPGH